MILDNSTNKKMTLSNGNWLFKQTADKGETYSATLTTANQFIDKNIIIQTVIPSANTPALAITNTGNTVIAPTTASSGYYPVNQSITGTLSVGTAGWIATSGLSATDSDVALGKLTQSTLKNGTTDITSGTTVVPDANDQTIKISAGYYHTERTIVVAKLSNGSVTQAEANISMSKQATAPTLANTASAITNQTQVAIVPSKTAPASGKYYIAMTATAPATTFAATNINKTVSQVGYLGEANQITASGSTSQNTTLYYAPLTTASVSIKPSATPNATATKVTKAVTGKSQILSSVTPSTSTSGINKYYIAVNANATSVDITNTASNLTPGYLGSVNDMTLTANKTTAKTNTYYIPVTSGALSAGDGTASATGTNMVSDALTASDTTPNGVPFITVTGSGSASVGTTGWLEAGTAQSSSTTTKYYKLKQGSVTWDPETGVVARTAGYITDGSISVGRGSLANVATQNVTYAENTEVILNEQGYLYINQGYFPATKISLATLIPDDVDYTNAGTSQMLANYEAYDTDGKKLIGTIMTYAGDYSFT